MPKGDIETYYEDGKWKNKVEGGSRASNTADTKAEAQAKGRAGVFADYRLRVASVIRDYGMNERAEAPRDSRKAHG